MKFFSVWSRQGSISSFCASWRPSSSGGVFLLAVPISIKEIQGKLPISLCPYLRDGMLLQAVENVAEGCLPVGFKGCSRVGWQGAITGALEGSRLKATPSLTQLRCFCSYSRCRSFVQKSLWNSGNSWVIEHWPHSGNPWGNLIASSFLEVNIIDCFLQKDQGKDQAVLLVWRWEGGKTGRKGQGAQ